MVLVRMRCCDLSVLVMRLLLIVMRMIAVRCRLMRIRVSLGWRLIWLFLGWTRWVFRVVVGWMSLFWVLGLVSILWKVCLLWFVCLLGVL